jgi:hypothetical protein
VHVRKQTAIARPVARTEGLLVESVGEETVIYDLNTKEAHCLKSLAAAVFSYANGSNTTEDIAELAAYRLGTPVSAADVADAVSQLEGCALLDSPLAVRDGLSRREAVGKFAKIGVVATATPLIASVLAPAAALAGSKIPTGGCCGDTKTDRCTGGNPLCESNHCCQNTDATAKACNPCKCVGDKNDCSVQQCDPTQASLCPDITINGVPTQSCGKKSGSLGGSCCYPDFNGECCTVVLNTNGLDVAC